MARLAAERRSCASLNSETQPLRHSFRFPGAVGHINCLARYSLWVAPEGAAFDEHGNVAQRTDCSGAVLDTSLFDAFGTKLSPNTQSDPSGYGAQAGYYTETGLILCTHRYYDPSVGRWLNRDPMGYGGGINLYGYVGGNPTSKADPSGMVAGIDDIIEVGIVVTIIESNPDVQEEEEELLPVIEGWGSEAFSWLRGQGSSVGRSVCNLFSGRKPMPGAVNVDVDPNAPGANYVTDLQDMP